MTQVSLTAYLDLESNVGDSLGFYVDIFQPDGTTAYTALASYGALEFVIATSKGATPTVTLTDGDGFSVSSNRITFDEPGATFEITAGEYWYALRDTTDDDTILCGIFKFIAKV